MKSIVKDSFSNLRNWDILIAHFAYLFRYDLEAMGILKFVFHTSGFEGKSDEYGVEEYIADLESEFDSMPIEKVVDRCIAEIRLSLANMAEFSVFFDCRMSSSLDFKLWDTCESIMSDFTKTALYTLSQAKWIVEKEYC